MLEELGYEVETASKGKAAVLKLERHRFEVVVTGCRMPDMRGLRIVRQIRESSPGVPIVILSGLVEKLGLSKESTGADAVLKKGPTESRDLTRAIARLLRKKPRSQKSSSRKSRTAGKAG